MIKIERYTQYDATYFARVVKALLQYGKSFRLETHKTLELFVTSIVIIKVVNGTLGIVVFYDAKNVTEIYFKSPVHGMQLEVAIIVNVFLLPILVKTYFFWWLQLKVIKVIILTKLIRMKISPCYS
jgi:uncharacterized membrane protein YidH (DUF202 family)